MKVQIISVYDAAVGEYLQPTQVRTTLEGLRAFKDAVNNPQSDFHKWPSDYTLFNLGEFDTETGIFTQTVDGVHHRLGMATELLDRDIPPEGQTDAFGVVADAAAN